MSNALAIATAAFIAGWVCCYITATIHHYHAPHHRKGGR